MKSQLETHSYRMFFLAIATILSLLTVGCSKPSSAPEAKSPEAKSEDKQTSTIFGNEIAFTGYTVQSNKANHTELELRWTALRAPAAAYSVFVHALDSSGAIAFQGDHPLTNAGGLPTTSWTAGEAVSDRFQMTPPAPHPAGSYTLRIGLYTLNPIKLLQLTHAVQPMPTDGWKDHAILLAGVECK
jgi:hypothetical protein